MSDSTEISSLKTVADWKAICPSLRAGADVATWTEVIRDFFRDRLQTRYLDPIAAIPRLRKGEGFAIVALQCSLVEFLEGCYRGINYKFKNPVPPYEYNRSGEIFVSFLTERRPFNAYFTTPALAQDFYESVRCGILHEARTKGDWLVWAASSTRKIIDTNGPILYRDDFQAALVEYIDAYCAAVPLDPDRQAAFVRKYEHLCT